MGTIPTLNEHQSLSYEIQETKIYKKKIKKSKKKKNKFI